MMMLCLLLYIQAFGQVVSEVLPPLQDVHVNGGLLRWTASPQHRNASYSVQYRSSDKKWKDVLSCIRTTLTSCDVTSMAAETEHGCVMLRLRAEQAGLSSQWVEACSKEGDRCSPEVRLAARPGFLTVYLNRNHSLALQHGDHAKHRVYYGKEGQPLRSYEDAASSVSVSELEEGQRYCIKVQYLYYGVPIGAPSCTQCVLIPESSVKTQLAEIGVTVVVVVIMVPVVIAVAYILIFKHKRIKKWLRPPYEMPELVFRPLPESHRLLSMRSPSEECFDMISVVIPQDSSHGV
ncbi:hypothetical protein LDENG_00033680 [Lucifuga dentata]|nr:hypothetical protein LDENG_00033680 [Lucifuga dentata]